MGSKTTCLSCDSKLRRGRSFCPSCKQPTVFASHDERVRWEMEQWREARDAAPTRRLQAVVEDGPQPKRSFPSLLRRLNDRYLRGTADDRRAAGD